MKIPFSWLPASWGLKGKSREQARIEYELDGEEQERALAELHNEDETARSVALLAIDIKYKRIQPYEGERKRAELLYQGNALEQQYLDIDLKFSKIDQQAFDKGVATINGEPWVAVKDTNFNPKRGLSGFSMELDYNDHFVTMLRENGFEGRTDEQVVNDWFTELCKQVADENDFVTPVTTSVETTTEISSDGKIKYT